MYSKIVNPKTGRKVSETSRLGKNILKKYLNVLTGGAAPVVAEPNVYNGEDIPWIYTGEALLRQGGWSMTTLGAGVRVVGHPAYYFKTLSIGDRPVVYWGPLYYHSDGTYRSNNSMEAAMMRQKYKLSNNPAMWAHGYNQADAALDPLPHNLILIKPDHPSVGLESSPDSPGTGSVVRFKWNVPADATTPLPATPHTNSSTMGNGTLIPITKEQWMTEGSELSPVYNLAYIKRVEEQERGDRVDRLAKNWRKKTRASAFRRIAGERGADDGVTDYAGERRLKREHVQVLSGSDIQRIMSYL